MPSGAPRRGRPTAGLGVEGGREALIRQERWIDPPGQVTEVVERVRPYRAAAPPPSRARAQGRGRSSSPRAAVSPGARPAAAARHRGCPAPASSLASSCAATIRRRDSRRSSISRTFRRTSPACAAMSRTSFAFVGFIGSAAVSATVSAPRRSPWCRTSNASSPSKVGSSSPRTATLAAAGASRGQEVSARSSFPMRSQTLAVRAPVASARSWAIRGRTSSVE